LEGARKTLEKYRPLILLEVHSEKNGIAVNSILNSLGYTIEVINRASPTRYFIEATYKK
jgi:hypothetical protein